MEPQISQYEQERRAKLQKLRELGVDPYGQPTQGVSPLRQIKESYKPEMGHDGGPIVTGAGRIILKRDMGKLSFITLRDESGDLQVGLDKKRLDELAWKVRDLLDLGDQIVISGPLGTTNKGETTIWATSLAMSSKALLPPPAKWEGLEDVELRYRQRYVDLWANPQVMKMMQLRIRVIDEIRSFLKGRGFVEVETPMMQVMHGGAAARPFITKHNALDMNLFMRIAPELYLKRLLVGGFTKVFELNRNFRNEGISPRHNPEFTMLEAYEAYGSWETMAELVESMVCHVAQTVFGTLKIRHYDCQGIEAIDAYLKGDIASLSKVCARRLDLIDSRPDGVHFFKATQAEREARKTGSEGYESGQAGFDAYYREMLAALVDKSREEQRKVLAEKFIIKTINLEGDSSRPVGQRWRRARMVGLIEEQTPWRFDKTPLQVASSKTLDLLVTANVEEWVAAMRDSWQKAGKIDEFDEARVRKNFLNSAGRKAWDRDRIVSLTVAEQLVEVYERLIEPTLDDPTFVTHVPSVAIPLARESKDDPFFADVYELAINGVEISPGYSELNDPEVQARHFAHQVGDKEEQQKTDEDFLTALKYGMPPAGGMGMGIDRLLMMLTGAESIRDVILFPLMRPQA